MVAGCCDFHIKQEFCYIPRACNRRRFIVLSICIIRSFVDHENVRRL